LQIPQEFNLLRALIIVAAFAALLTSANAYDAKTKQDLKALEQLSTKQDECLAAIDNAQRHGNVWQEEQLSMQECRDIAMKLIRNGTKLMEDSTRDESDPD
jgi:hypothetical protein